MLVVVSHDAVTMYLGTYLVHWYKWRLDPWVVVVHDNAWFKTGLGSFREGVESDGETMVRLEPTSVLYHALCTPH